jgi:hypothetical protein
VDSLQRLGKEKWKKDKARAYDWWMHKQVHQRIGCKVPMKPSEIYIPGQEEGWQELSPLVGISGLR